MNDDICIICGKEKAIRNPTGNCDHLYYPENLASSELVGTLREAKQQIESLKKKLENARKCDWCGETDLVCGKGWQEERELLKKEVANWRKTADEFLIETIELQSEIERLKDPIHWVSVGDFNALYEQNKVMREALEKIATEQKQMSKKPCPIHIGEGPFTYGCPWPGCKLNVMNYAKNSGSD